MSVISSSFEIFGDDNKINVLYCHNPSMAANRRYVFVYDALVIIYKEKKFAISEINVLEIMGVSNYTLKVINIPTVVLRKFSSFHKSLHNFRHQPCSLDNTISGDINFL